MQPIQASIKTIQNEVYKNIGVRSKKGKPKFNVGDLLGTSKLCKTFSKGDTTNWSYGLYTKTKTLDDTSHSYYR